MRKTQSTKLIGVMQGHQVYCLDCRTRGATVKGGKEARRERGTQEQRGDTNREAPFVFCVSAVHLCVRWWSFAPCSD